MKKSDVTCPECNASYRRIETSIEGAAGEFHCSSCGHLLEVFDGKSTVAFVLMFQLKRRSSSEAWGQRVTAALDQHERAANHQGTTTTIIGEQKAHAD
jgi:predicted Zn finger-like uncharacterized protein